MLYLFLSVSLRGAQGRSVHTILAVQILAVKPKGDVVVIKQAYSILDNPSVVIKDKIPAMLTIITYEKLVHNLIPVFSGFIKMYLPVTKFCGLFENQIKILSRSIEKIFAT